LISRLINGPARHRWRTATLAAVCAAAVALGGCSGTGTSGGGGGATAKGGTITAVTPTLASTDPQGALAQDTGTSTIAKAIFSRLVVPNGSGFAPQLATKWSHSADGLSWTFTLNPAAKFSDKTPVTANDVKASLRRVVDLKGVNAALFAAVSSVTAKDDHTLVIDTKTPVGTLLYSLSLLYVAPADRINQPGFWKKPIGSGPFKLDSFAVGNRAVLVRNPNYWGTPAHLDKVVLEVVPEVSGQVAALQTGEVDVVTNLPEDQIASVKGMGDAKIDESDSLAILSIWFDNADAPFTDARVRQAMWYAVDWASIRQNLYGQTANPGRAPIGSGVFGFAAQPPYPYDPAKAKALLAAAGKPHGFTTSIKYVPTAIPQIQSALQAAVGDWAKVGVKVNLVPQESAVWTTDLLGLKWSMTALLNTSRTADADQILGRLYTTSAKRVGFGDAKYDALVQDAAASFDQTKRAADYAQAIHILWSQAVGNWPLELKATYAVRDRVKGFVPDPSNVPDFATVSVTGS
jgi:peptide/nickel transport system substrate-binding protein